MTGEAIAEGHLCAEPSPSSSSLRLPHVFHVRIGESGKVTGFVTAEQIKSIDFRAHSAKRIAKAPAAVLDEVLSILDACLY